MSDDLLRSHHEGVLTLTLNRPAARNALSRSLVSALSSTIQEAVNDKGTRVIILTGTPPAFCAGLDLRELAADTADGEADITHLVDLYEQLDTVSLPLVAAVNGPACAGGAVLTCIADIVIAAESATVGFPGIRRGILAPIVMPYLVRAVGERRAAYLLLTGTSLPANDAREAGLVNEVVLNDDLVDRVQVIARELAAAPRDACTSTKAILRDLRGLSPTELGPAAQRIGSHLPLSEAVRAGIDRFLQG